MCVTTGRSGTNLLQELLALADDTSSLHEPEPGFQHVLKDVPGHPEAAISFVRDRKLPDILARPGRNYVETSHVFGKGFFEAFLALNVPFRLIILNRDPRQVAISFRRIRAVPHHTHLGRVWLLQPGQQDVMPLPGWQWMTEYQLTYWYCLEIERRKTLYAEECRKRGIPVVEIHLEQLKDWSRFQELCAACGLTLPDGAQERHAAITAHRVNPKEEWHTRRSRLPYGLQEWIVWKALGSQGPALRRAVRARYGRSGDGASALSFNQESAA